MEFETGINPVPTTFLSKIVVNYQKYLVLFEKKIFLVKKSQKIFGLKFGIK